MASILSELSARGAIYDLTHPTEIESLLEHERIAFYCGFDPTADSLHVGSLLPLVVMRRLQKAGHRPIALLGGATGMIGDPSGKSEERRLLANDTIENNLPGLKAQIAKILSFEGENSCLVVNNRDWTESLSVLEFLRDVGKHFSVNAMMAKDSVRARLENREQGISYTEFSYMLLQAYDFWNLYQHHACRLQIGGSDQWGNITAGTDLIRRRAPEGSPQAYGFTLPLLMKSDGTKFGKSEGGNVWLDAKRTSPYRFYQFWLNTEDADVIRLLKLFSEHSLEEIGALEESLQREPEARKAQKALAAEMTTLLHGQAELEKAIQASEILFGKDFGSVDSGTLLDIFSNVPSTTIPRAELSAGIPIAELLVRCALVDSKGAARRLLESGGVYVNNARIVSSAAVGESNLVDGKIVVLRSGKRNYHLVKCG